MNEKLAENILASQKVLLSYLSTNLWLGGLTLVLLVVVAVLLWQHHQTILKIERQATR